MALLQGRRRTNAGLQGCARWGKWSWADLGRARPVVVGEGCL